MLKKATALELREDLLSRKIPELQGKNFKFYYNSQQEHEVDEVDEVDEDDVKCEDMLDDAKKGEKYKTIFISIEYQ